DDDGPAEQSEVEEDDDDDRKSRKHSVVSVSTTISTKTEAISPQPSLRPSFARSPSSEDGAENAAAQLAELGPPPFHRALLLLAQMSSAGNLFTPEYTQACVDNARQNREFVMGFIAQRGLNEKEGDNFITMTPGVQLSAGGDAMGQQYNTPRKVVGEGGTDIIIVGRGVLKAEDRQKAALEYRKQGWIAYEERIRAGRKL
ncbi:hypothetical protein KC346_g17601, partial [Hortaea werneckii]